MNIPADFLNSIRLLLKDEIDVFLSAITDTPPVSIRFNPLKSEGKLSESLEIGERVPWSEWGFYLEKRPSFTFDPLFHSGYYYVQEASSMFVEHIVRQLVDKPLNCLDLCAAPGGKSVSLLSALPKGSHLTANETIRHRANILSETIIKYGNPNTTVTNNEPKDFVSFPGFFDLILVDAPCSGEGMFRKDEVAISEWSAGNVTMCAARQKNILNDVWPALKPRGILIYSTCTYNTAENEENVLWSADELGADFEKVDFEIGWGITHSFNENVVAYRFFPHKTKGEGLFVAVLRKSADGANAVLTPQIFNQRQQNFSQKSLIRNRNEKKTLIYIKDYTKYTKYLNNPDDFIYIQDENRILAIPKENSDTILALNKTLRVISMGIELGVVKGNDFIPSHALAMSSELNREAFAIRELTYNEAISYLRREAISIPDAPNGFVLLTFKNEPLGFVKNIGNRANNLYPDKWRIRT